MSRLIVAAITYIESRCTIGKTSKPLHIQLDRSLYETNTILWQRLEAQGHTIQIIDGPHPDLCLASYAMRMTGDMLNQLPSALDLAIKGARILRHAPLAKDEKAWKGTKGAKGKSTHTRKNSKVKTTASTTREPVIEATSTGTREPAVVSTSEITHREGTSQPT